MFYICRIPRKMFKHSTVRASCSNNFLGTRQMLMHKKQNKKKKKTKKQKKKKKKNNNNKKTKQKQNKQQQQKNKTKKNKQTNKTRKQQQQKQQQKTNNKTCMIPMLLHKKLCCTLLTALFNCHKSMSQGNSTAVNTQLCGFTYKHSGAITISDIIISIVHNSKCNFLTSKWMLPWKRRFRNVRR